MTTEKTNTYEGLFLFPPSAAGSLQEAVDHLKGLLDRAGAEILSFRKWDERRLAYEIKGNKRGIYFLAYFKAPTTNMPGLERDCNLSEHLLRTMITRAEHLTAEQVEAADGRQELEDEIRVKDGGDSEPAPARSGAAAGSESGKDG